MISIGKTNEDLSNSKWTTLENELTPMLEFYHNLTFKVQSDKQTSISLVRPAINPIHLLIMEDGDSVIVRAFKSVSRKKFHDKFEPKIIIVHGRQINHG